MTQVVGQLFGGGQNKAAAREAAQSRELQRIANDRQLADAGRGDAESTISRRRPRGRRLFEDAEAALPSTLGG